VGDGPGGGFAVLRRIRLGRELDPTALCTRVTALQADALFWQYLSTGSRPGAHALELHLDQLRRGLAASLDLGW
jgi:hypothetical protein